MNHYFWWLTRYCSRTPAGLRLNNPVPYEIACACGGALKGVRAERFQAVPCPSCGRRRFVLPFSRLPPIEGEAAAKVLPPSPRSKWLLPLGAASGTLAGVILLFVLVLGFAGRQKSAPRGEGLAAIPGHLAAGRQALEQGKFRQAANELGAADAIRERFPDALGAAERRQLKQLRRQAELLGDLLPESLDEVLRHAADLTELDEREWQEAFAARYQNKAILFDDEVRHEGAGVYRLVTYPFFVRGRPAQVALGDLHVLRALPLDRPQRLLLGARLASVRPEAGGVWVVHLVPDSGVLLTDAGAVRACYPVPAEELRAVLERQAAWVAEQR